MDSLLIHGANWGDTIYAAQRSFYLDYCDWCTDLYNKPLIEFLIEYTNCPIENAIYLKTQATDNVGKAKFVPYRKWKLNQWMAQYKGYQRYDIYKPDLQCNKHSALQAASADKPYKIITSKIRTNDKLITISCDTWNNKRKYDRWNEVQIPNGYKAIEIVYNKNFYTRYPKVRSNNVEETAEIILRSSLVVGVSSFTTCFSASLGIPTIKLCQNNYDRTYLGVSIFGGIDLPIDSDPREISKSMKVFCK